LVTKNLAEEKKATSEIEINLQVQYTFASVATEENLVARTKPWCHMYIGKEIGT
jgi:hypothetical protein